MIYVPVFWLLYFVYRALRGAREGSATVEMRDVGDTGGYAPPRQSAVDARYLVVWLLGGFTVIVAGVWLTRAPVASAAALAVAALALAPWLFTRYVLIPLGLMRASAFGARLARWSFRHDAGDGAAALAAALALSRKRPPTERDLSWLATRLDAPSPWPMRGATIAAHALLATVRNDPARALCLFESIELLHPRVAPRIARRIAARYRMAVAAFRGDWISLAERAGAYRRLTRSAWCYGALAAWHLGSRSAWSAIKLRLFWALAPDRRRTRTLVASAIASASTTSSEAPGSVEPPAWPHAVIAPFDDALRKHAALAMAPDGPGLGEAWRACASAWQRVFEDDAVAARAVERGKELGVEDPQQMLSVFGSLVRVDLANEARRPGVGREDLTKGGRLGAWVVSHLGDEDLRDLDYRANALLERDRARTSIPIVEDWAELATIHSKLERSSERLGDLFARTAFGAIHGRVGNHAARIYNLRNEQPIAHAAFSWLARCAERVGDDSALTLYRKHASLGF